MFDASLSKLVKATGTRELVLHSLEYNLIVVTVIGGEKFSCFIDRLATFVEFLTTCLKPGQSFFLAGYFFAK